MKHTPFLLLFALLAPLALKAQTSSQGTAAGQGPTTSAQSGQLAKPASLDNDPAFKKLSPEQQAWVRQMTGRLNKAIAENDTAAIDQLAKETADHVNQLKNGDSSVTYHYQNNAPAPNAQPAKPPAPSPCQVAPKHLSFAERMKERAKRAIEKQAAKADARVGTATKGNVDGGIQDTTHTVITEADQTNPCGPAKGQPAKQ